MGSPAHGVEQMKPLIDMLIDQLMPYVLAGGLALFSGILFWVRQSGRKAEIAKQAEREAEARDIADRVDNDVGALPPKEARDQLKGWAR